MKNFGGKIGSCYPNIVVIDLNGEFDVSLLQESILFFFKQHIHGLICFSNLFVITVFP